MLNPENNTVANCMLYAKFSTSDHTPGGGAKKGMESDNVNPQSCTQSNDSQSISPVPPAETIVISSVTGNIQAMNSQSSSRDDDQLSGRYDDQSQGRKGTTEGKPFIVQQISLHGKQFNVVLDDKGCPAAPPTGLQKFLDSLSTVRTNPEQTRFDVDLSAPVCEDQPLYVNAKQYQRILKRRQQRAKLEALGRIPKARKKFLYESRHRHAVNRQRGNSGRFSSRPAVSACKKVVQKPDKHTLKLAESSTTQGRIIPVHTAVSAGKCVIAPVTNHTTASTASRQKVSVMTLPSVFPHFNYPHTNGAENGSPRTTVIGSGHLHTTATGSGHLHTIAAGSSNPCTIGAGGLSAASVDIKENISNIITVGRLGNPQANSADTQSGEGVDTLHTVHVNILNGKRLSSPGDTRINTDLLDSQTECVEKSIDDEVNMLQKGVNNQNDNGWSNLQINQTIVKSASLITSTSGGFVVISEGENKLRFLRLAANK